MSELLSAGLYRLRRAKLLWIVCLLLALVSAGYVAWSWQAAQRYYPPVREGALKELTGAMRASYMDSAFFSIPSVAVLLSSAVCAWELGAEYQNGAQRNKLTVGHKRRDVYLTSLLLTVLVCVLLCLAAFLPGIPVMLLTVGGFGMGWTRALLSMAGMTAASAAFASLFTLLGLNIQNRAASAIAGIFLTLALLLTGSLVDRPLAQPEGWTTLTPGAGVGGAAVEVMTPNPSYLPRGPVRDALNALESLLPGGQVAGFSRADADSPAALALGAAAWIVSTSALGFLIFRRKDLR